MLVTGVKGREVNHTSVKKNHIKRKLSFVSRVHTFYFPLRFNGNAFTSHLFSFLERRIDAAIAIFKGTFNDGAP